jgi:hypothetical protein
VSRLPDLETLAAAFGFCCSLDARDTPSMCWFALGLENQGKRIGGRSHRSIMCTVSLRCLANARSMLQDLVNRRSHLLKRKERYCPSTSLTVRQTVCRWHLKWGEYRVANCLQAHQHNRQAAVYREPVGGRYQPQVCLLLPILTMSSEHRQSSMLVGSIVWVLLRSLAYPFSCGCCRAAW